MRRSNEEKETKPENLSLGTDDEKFLQLVGVKDEKQDTGAPGGRVLPPTK